jgi:uncharacterized membrane protein
VTLGAIASALALGAGWWLRRRFGETHSSVAAAAAGIAGFYATLPAASVRYDLVPNSVGLALAAGIAAAATLTALSWHDELLASIGLVGAVLAPVAVAAHEHDQSAAGVAFVALMLAAAVVVGLRRAGTGSSASRRSARPCRSRASASTARDAPARCCCWRSCSGCSSLARESPRRSHAAS